LTDHTMTETPYDPELQEDPGQDSVDPVSDLESREPEPQDASSGDDEDMGDVIKELEALVKERDEQLDGYRKIFDDLKADAESRIRKTDEESFFKQVRESYQKDPVSAFRMMMERSRHELWEAFQDQLQLELRRDVQFRKTMGEVMAQPANGVLKPYADEMEFLAAEKGFDVNEAAELLRRLDQKARSVVRDKADAARRVRHRSTVESGGASSHPPDPDREFYRIIKKAKTLDDMFEGLRRAGRRHL
jgi:hypothetical protein